MILILAVLPMLVLAQQRDAGTPPVTPAGTAEISGVVLTAGSNPEPVRRAVVTLTGGTLHPRSILTGDDGRFTFAALPDGAYSLTARKAAYLAAPYGARKPGRAGMSIALAPGERSNITISIFRGAAISGVVRDTSGRPIPGVTVRVIDARTLLTLTDSSPIELATTDDRGVFRIFGLLPGDYFVVALPAPIGQGEIIAPGSTYLDSVLAALSSRQGVGPQQSIPVQPQRAVGFAPVFHPGTSSHVEAASIHLEAGEERAGINLEMRPVPVAAIDGTISGDVTDLTRVQISIIPSGPRVATGMSSNSLSGQPPDKQGRFRYTNLPPGTYRIVARARRGQPETPGLPGAVNPIVIPRAGGTPTSAVPAPPADYLYGFADVELRGDDVAGINVILQPGGVLSGRVVFTGTAAPPKGEDLSKIRASLSLIGATGGLSSGGLIMGTMLISNPASLIGPDGTFEIRDIGPGRFRLNAGFGSAPNTAGWKLRSAMADGRDLLDGPLELGPGTDIRNVVILFSDTRTEISGSLQTQAGVLTTDYYIIALPADRSLWRFPSRRILSTRPSTDGRFVFADLPAGEYLIAALEDLDSIDLGSTSFLEQIAPAGLKVTATEGQTTVQNLRIK